MNSDTLTQVSIVFDNREYVCWIPSQFAARGKIISIDGVVERGAVKDVYSTVSYSAARERSSDWSRQRRASDI